MPKKRTPTMARFNSAIEGCSAAAEIKYADAAIKPMPAPIVPAPSNTASAIHHLNAAAKRARRRNSPIARSCQRELAIRPVARKQGVMLAAFDHASVFNHHNFIRAIQGGETMRDEQRRTSAHQTLRRFAQLRFEFGVNARGRLVQNQ